MYSLEHRIEKVGNGVSVFIGGGHTFGTDAFLLSDFAAPRRDDVACDLGCGCGIVPLLWFRGESAPKRVTAVDIQAEAVELLRQSARHSGLEERLVPVEADLRALKGVLPAGGFSLVTCNPPYYRRGSGYRSREEPERVARHETLCTLGEVCATAGALLKYGGRFCLCHLPERLTDVFAAMRDARIEPKRLRTVHQRAGDAPWLMLVEGRRGGKPSLKVERPLILREDDSPSAEMERIYSMYGKV